MWTYGLEFLGVFTTKRHAHYSPTRVCIGVCVKIYDAQRLRLLDYCNSALFGCKTSVIRRLQSIHNSSSRLILNTLKLARMTTAIRDTLHVTVLLVWNCVNESAPIYLQKICNSVSADAHQLQLPCADHGDLVVATRQHWQIRSARFFCVRAKPVEQATTAHSESVWWTRTICSSIENFSISKQHWQALLRITSEGGL